ncbi:helix-turn-helix domain-containing protein [Fulvivirgaceae bacterium BMA12]|uniref:Helix-turn-helix domain-containing protein n=1 Tax=Agaribacillus aureus TaxID=3051825 RepID=A0ABT8LFA6_9BACT|nr:helix-turn-helix domain-containing protein [Fulvivirgaceae bacterium BMA12]
MNVIHIEEEAFHKLVNEVVERIIAEHNAPAERWIDGEEAMHMLKVKSTTTLQNYRDEGKIRFSQPSKKVILYDRFSIEEFIEQNVKDTF